MTRMKMSLRLVFYAIKWSKWIVKKNYGAKFIMSFGIENRLSKIFKPESGKTVMLAVDHGYFQGPTTGLEDLKKTLAPLSNLADCLFITRGMLINCVEKNIQ